MAGHTCGDRHISGTIWRDSDHRQQLGIYNKVSVVAGRGYSRTQPYSFMLLSLHYYVDMPGLILIGFLLFSISKDLSMYLVLVNLIVGPILAFVTVTCLVIIFSDSITVSLHL